MNIMSYEESGMEMPGPHTMRDGKEYYDDKHRGDAENFDTEMDENFPIIQYTFQNGDALIRSIISNISRSSGSNRKHTSRGRTSHAAYASLSSTNSATLIAPASQSSNTYSRNGHVRHASVSAINGATQDTPIVDEISKLISRLATEVSKMREQLRFVEARYEGAIEETRKAQDIINSLEEERRRAVEEARREREKVRILEQEIKLKQAREAGYEVGRRLGMEEGLKRGAAEGKRYGGEDGREAELERQWTATRGQVEDGVFEPRLPRERHEESSEPREIYNRVGDETPGLSRSRSPNVNPTLAPVVTVDLQTQTANVIGFPLQTGNPTAVTYPPTVAASPSGNVSAPLGNREQPNRRRGPPNYGAVFPRDNPNINILSVFEEDPVTFMGVNAPELSMEASLSKQDNRTSAPPRINTSSVDGDGGRSYSTQQRSWGGAIIGNGQGYRAPNRHRSGPGSTNGTGINGAPRTTGGTSVAPSSSSTRDTIIPPDRYGILGDGGNHSSGLISQVAEMTPIIKAGSEPGTNSTREYLQDTALGVTQPQAEIDRHERERREKEQRDAAQSASDDQERLQQQQQQNQQWQSQQPPLDRRHIPPHQLTSQPGPTNTNGPCGVNDRRRRSPQPPSLSTRETLVNDSARGPLQGNSVPGANVPPTGHPRGNSINAPRGHGRVASMHGGGSASVARRGTGGRLLPPIPGTLPEQANARSTRIAQAGSNLMGSPAFVTRDIGDGIDPGVAGGSHRRASGSQINGGGIHYGPHGTPLTGPQPMWGPLITGGVLGNEYVESEPTGDTYQPSSPQQRHGNTRQGKNQGGAHQDGPVSLGGTGDHGRHQQPPPLLSRFTTELCNSPATPLEPISVSGSYDFHPILRRGMMYNSAPTSPVTAPKTAAASGYSRHPGQSLAPLGPLSNGGLAFSVSGSAG